MQSCSVMFIYQEVFESIVIVRTVNRIKRTSGISTILNGKYFTSGPNNINEIASLSRASMSTKALILIFSVI